MQRIHDERLCRLVLREQQNRFAGRKLVLNHRREPIDLRFRRYGLAQLDEFIQSSYLVPQKQHGGRRGQLLFRLRHIVQRYLFIVGQMDGRVDLRLTDFRRQHGAALPKGVADGDDRARGEFLRLVSTSMRAVWARPSRVAA